MEHSVFAPAHLPTGLKLKLGRPLVLAPAFTPSVGIADPTYMFVKMVPQGAVKLDGLTVGIIYSDAKSEKSTRLVRLERLWIEDSVGYVTGYCFMRSAIRQFRLDRIDSVVDPETGELIGSGSDYFSGMADDSHGQKRLSAWDEVRDGIRILSAFSAIDGKLYKAEVQVIADYVRFRMLKLGYELDEKEANTVIKIIKSMRPTVECAIDALSRVKKNRGHALDVLGAIKATCMADGELNEEELEFINLLGIKIIKYGALPDLPRPVAM